MTVDRFQTPAAVAKYMVDLLDPDERLILEPTWGTGNLVRELKNKNKIVIYPDDFFLLKPDVFDAVVMNPPFSSETADLTNAPAGLKGMAVGYYILEKCMQMSDHVVALMPWFTIADSDVRMRTLIQYGIKSVCLLERKTFNYTRIQTAVIDLSKGHSGPMEFKYFSTINI